MSEEALLLPLFSVEVTEISDGRQQLTDSPLLCVEMGGDLSQL